MLIFQVLALDYQSDKKFMYNVSMLQASRKVVLDIDNIIITSKITIKKDFILLFFLHGFTILTDERKYHTG